MLRQRSRKGQAVMPEYVVMFFIVVAALMAMGTFLQRTFQARTRDVTRHMVDIAAQACRNSGPDCEAAANFQNGTMQPYYEPYYGMVNSIVDHSSMDNRMVQGGVTIRQFGDTVQSSTISVQRPPQEAN